MYTKMIRLMSDGRMHSQYELSRELEISPETVQAFIEYLSMRGTLFSAEPRSDEAACANSCRRCMGCKGCLNKKPLEYSATLWVFRDELNKEN